MRRIDNEERRARLGLRHALSTPVGGALEAARTMVALHATDPTTVFLSVLARWPEATVEAIEDALYRERSLLRLLAMRRTMFVVPTELAGAVHHGCSVAVGEQSRKTYLKYLRESGIDADDAWLDRACAAALTGFAGREEVTAAELSAGEPLLRTQITMSPGKSYGRSQNVTGWIMILLAARGQVVRGRPQGAWTSSQWRWSSWEKWLPGGLSSMSAEQARAELARAWLGSFGPATAADLRWWAGWTAAQAKHALAQIGAVEVALEDGTGFVLADDVDPVSAQQPWVALLPALDPTPMGWQQREWYLGPHHAAVFDRTGNVGPTVWCDGRIVGGWVQRTDGTISHTLVEDVGREARTAIEEAAARLEPWLGEARLSARGRAYSPLEQQLR